ncbi:DUF697 domain-containing protein [Desulfobacterales bacterium HSG2]|nr:DUF697 domain-containing protein [Desulfobacterales bacterium HSG2]
METETTTVTETTAEGVSKDELDRLIRHHVYGSMAVGLIPIPLVDFACVTLIQMNMLRVLARRYDVPFSKDVVKNILSALVGGMVPATASLPLAASISKTVPVAGTAAGIVTMPIIGGASTYAVGKVFIQHFASGGTFLTFNPEKVREYYAEMFKEGKNVAGAAK